MIKHVIFLSILLMLFFSTQGLYAQWKVYDCSVLPQDFTGTDSLFTESNATNTDEVTEVLSVVDDPDVPGNKLIQVASPAESFKEMWKMKWNADPETGATLVFRVVTLDTNAVTYDRGFDLYFLNGMVEERLVSNVTANSSDILLDRSKVRETVNTKIWRIYRITMLGNSIEVYIDEDPLSYLSVKGLSKTDNYFRFGDGGSNKIGSLYDWIIWDVSGAYAPGQGTPIPDSLYGNPAAIDVVDLTQPDNFHLAQNYPNPFNPSTDIQFSISQTEQVKLTIYNLNGQIIRSLLNEKKQPGTYKVNWDGRDSHGNKLTSGTYFYSLEAGQFKDSKRMILLK
jgi:hypothetical protein